MIHFYYSTFPVIALYDDTIWNKKTIMKRDEAMDCFPVFTECWERNNTNTHRLIWVHTIPFFYYSSQHPIKLKTNERPWSRGKTKTIFYRWNINPQVQYLNIWWCGNIISLFHSLLDSIIGMSALTRWLFCHQTFDFMEHKLFSLLKISHMYTLWSSLVECVERLYDIIS